MASSRYAQLVCWFVGGMGLMPFAEEAEMDEEAEVWQYFEDYWEGMDTPQTRKDMPEAFLYPCCDNDLTSTGCRWRKHYATVEERDSDPERKDD